MHTVKLWKKQRKSGILQAGGKHIIFFPLKDYMKSKQRLTFFFLPTVSLRLQYSDCLVCLHIYLFLIPQLWICQLSHKIQIKLLILFPYLKFNIGVASVFNICKQPLIYVHIVHFNLWKGQSEKTKLFQDLQLQPGPFKSAESMTGDSSFHPEGM